MTCDVVIVGAGLVGASLAASLRGSGLTMTLLDAESEIVPARTGWDSRIYAVSAGSHDFLATCGAWQRIPPERIARVEAMQVFGDDHGAELHFSAYQAGLAELCFIVEGREIQRALREVNAQQDDIACRYDVRPSALSLGESSVGVDLDGETLEARVVVGADGAQSWVRDNAGIAVRGRAYGQQGVVANFETEQAHDAIARQWFRRDGVLALLPMPGNRVSMVWSTWDATAERLLALEAAEFEREIETVCRYALGALRLITPARAFPLRLLQVSEWVRPRLALVGDAAHNVHPLAGQGLNLGFLDACELARVLRDRGPQDDCGDYRLLRRYARARKESVATMQLATDGLQRLFSTSVFGIKWLRNTGLAFTNGIVPLKTLLVGHALG